MRHLKIIGAGNVCDEQTICRDLKVNLGPRNLTVREHLHAATRRMSVFVFD